MAKLNSVTIIKKIGRDASLSFVTGRIVAVC